MEFRLPSALTYFLKLQVEFSAQLAQVVSFLNTKFVPIAGNLYNGDIEPKLMEKSEVDLESRKSRG